MRPPKIGRFRRWLMVRRRIVLVQNGIARGGPNGVFRVESMTPIVPIVDLHSKLTTPAGEVLDGGVLAVGTAEWVRTRGGWSRYRCSIPVTDPTEASGGWWNVNGALRLVEITFVPMPGFPIKSQPAPAEPPQPAERIMDLLEP